MPEPQAARIAFVGAGNHATESLYPNISQIPEFDLVAVCDLVEEKARAAAKNFGAPESFTDVEKMLDSVAPQGVCVCGPPAMHHGVALQVLSRGIPVFIEKPPAPTLAESEELVSVARENGTWGMVAFMKRFAPANIAAKKFMATEDFGRLSTITLMHGSGPYNDMRRMLMFNGIHLLDVGRFLAGEVEEVFAYGLEHGDQIRAASVAMRFAGGAVGQLNMNSGHKWSECFEQVYVSGSGAGILIDSSRATDILSPSRRFAEDDEIEMFGWSSRYAVSGNISGWAAGGHYTRGYWGEMSRFARAVLGRAEASPSLEDGVANMKTIDAILTSLDTHQPVAVS